MTTFKCCNLQYSGETITTLVFNRNINISLTTTLYLRAIITTSNWTWDDDTTQQDRTISAGSNRYEFKFKYGGTVPTATTKYLVNVTFEWYTDSGYTQLKNTDYHTFELHFYHNSDWSSYVYDHAGFEGNYNSDNGLISISVSDSNCLDYVTALIEGTSCIRMWSNEWIQVLQIPTTKFFIYTYSFGTGSFSSEITVDGTVQPKYADGVPRKFYYYNNSGSNIDTKLRVWGSAIGCNPGDYIKLDGLYVFNPIP